MFFCFEFLSEYSDKKYNFVRHIISVVFQNVFLHEARTVDSVHLLLHLNHIKKGSQPVLQPPITFSIHIWAKDYCIISVDSKNCGPMF